MIGICTDSGSQMPAELAARLGVEVVPLTITIDDVDYLEGVDLVADDFYAKFTGDHFPVVASSEPSPGQFAAAYDDLVARGCTEILSIHITAAVSGTINAARLAAHATTQPVRVVDSGTASFGTSCCVWAAAEAIARGATLEQAAIVAEQLAPTIGNVFLVDSLDVLRRSNRWGDLPDAPGPAVLSFRNSVLEVLDRPATVLDALHVMARYTIGWGERLRVGVSHSDGASQALAEALESAVGEAASVIDLVRYRIGPSLGVHIGPGSVGCFMFPAE
jgi:DegV family protein with EDD domain